MFSQLQPHFVNKAFTISNDFMISLFLFWEI
jgi:hypothetical protein